MAKNSIIVSASRYRQIHACGIMPNDSYYIQLANRILRALLQERSIVEEYSREMFVTMAIRSVGYLEDVVSRIGLFAAFRKLHLKMCGRKLPFFTIDEGDYYDDEINELDVRFLVWCTIQEAAIEKKEDGRLLVNPDSEIMTRFSRLIIGILDEEYETAPENRMLYNIVHAVDFSDFLILGKTLYWLHYYSYLSMNYPKAIHEKAQSENFTGETELSKRDVHIIIDGIEKISSFRKVCTPLAITSVELLKAATSVPGAGKILGSLRYRNITNYRIIEWSNNILKVFPIDNPDEVLSISGNSFNTQFEPDQANHLMAALVLFRGLWHVNGFSLFDSRYEMERNTEKQSFAARRREETYSTCKILMKHTGGSPISFYRDMDEYIAFWSRIFPGQGEEFQKYSKNNRNLVLFAKPEFDMELVSDLAKWVKLPGNKLYDEKDAANRAISVLTGKTSTSLPLLSYLVKNNLIPDATLKSASNPERGRQIISENLWFIVRFFQPQLFDEPLLD